MVEGGLVGTPKSNRAWCVVRGALPSLTAFKSILGRLADLPPAGWFPHGDQRSVAI